MKTETLRERIISLPEEWKRHFEGFGLFKGRYKEVYNALCELDLATVDVKTINKIIKWICKDDDHKWLYKVCQICGDTKAEIVFYNEEEGLIWGKGVCNKCINEIKEYPIAAKIYRREKGMYVCEEEEEEEIDDRNIFDLTKEELLAFDIVPELKNFLELQWEIHHNSICAKCTHRSIFDGSVYRCLKAEIDASFIITKNDLKDKEGKVIGMYVSECPLYEEEQHDV